MATPAPKSLERQNLSEAKSVKEEASPIGVVAQGIDILGTAGFIYIIRSDLGCYLKAHIAELVDVPGSWHRWFGSDKAVYEALDLHRLCSGGDHYVGYSYHASKSQLSRGTALSLSLFRTVRVSLQHYESDYDFYRFYIIRGNNFRTVKKLTTAEDSSTSVLHSDCQQGDFYMALSTRPGTSRFDHHSYDTHWQSTTPIFIIIRDKKFGAFEDLETGERSQDYKELYNESHDGPYNLHVKCQGGLYYWASSNPVNRYMTHVMQYYILKEVDDCGNVTIHRTKNLSTDEEGEDVVVYSNSVMKFLPGGLSHKLKGQWNLLKVGTKDVDVGYNKEVLESVKHDWSMTDEIRFFGNKARFLERLFSTAIKQKYIFAKESKFEEETMQVVKCNGEPHSTVFNWQYVIMLIPENKLLLRTSYVEQTDSDTPPTITFERQAEPNPEDLDE